MHTIALTGGCFLGGSNGREAFVLLTCLLVQLTFAVRVQPRGDRPSLSSQTSTDAESKSCILHTSLHPFFTTFPTFATFFCISINATLNGRYLRWFACSQTSV